MSQFSNNYSRRKFLITAGVSAASTIFLKGCLGNPPEPTANTGSSPATTAVPVANISPEQAPEVTKIKLGFIPIVESAPLIIAKEKGFFAKYGMSDVEVSKQANWASARDNVTIGSDGGGIDGGQWQMPMPHLLTEGIITGGKKVPMYVLAQLNTNGNGVAISNTHLGKGIGLDIKNAAEYIRSFPSTNGRKFKAAYTFPNANQDFWIRYWLASGGIDPDVDIDLIAVPPAETVQGMRNGTMDAFSTGDPWPYRIVSDNIGFMSCLTTEVWPFHPEEYLAIRAESIRWGFHQGQIQDIAQAKALVDKVNREDIWREAAQEAGFTADIPTSTSRGVEKFFDGITFDPTNPEAYLQSLTIKKV